MPSRLTCFVAAFLAFYVTTIGSVAVSQSPQVRDRRGSLPAGDDSVGRALRSKRSSPEASEQAPLVPGFGVDQVLPPPPGFGVSDERLRVTIHDRDRRGAMACMRRSDSDRDGFLSQPEIARVRWQVDPYSLDCNHDGRLSQNELVIGYARQRAARNDSSTSGPAVASNRSASLTSRTPSAQTASSRMEMSRHILSSYDSNRNGILERQEWSAFRTDPSSADKNGDDKLSADELASWMQGRVGGKQRGDRGSGSLWAGFGANRPVVKGQRGGYSSRRESSRTRPPAASPGDLKSYRLNSANARLPAGLPSWFARQDTNADGQVAMVEFSRLWSASVVADFYQFDLNRDGMITPRECLTASDKGASRGSASRTRPTLTRIDPITRPSKTQASRRTDSAVAPEIDSMTLGFAKGNIRRYDDDGDGVLTSDEWKKMSRNPAQADANGDGKITPAELALSYRQQ